MRCRTAQILITRQLSEPLPPRPAAALTRHLAGCAGCRDEQAVMRRLTTRLQEAQPTPTPLPAPLVTTGWTRRQRVRPRRHTLLCFPLSPARRAPIGLALAAVALLVAGVI